ncbi:MAG TPA: hypothetical protein VK815_01460 [Candidatus Acidoferrales bacterium]|jgi:hypothetical protein|nr:hypothetical protein [Candidatus Acidoferrales bacterium]
MPLKYFPWTPVLLSALVIVYSSYAMIQPAPRKKAMKMQTVNHVDYVTFTLPSPYN